VDDPSAVDERVKVDEEIEAAWMKLTKPMHSLRKAKILFSAWS
jgi:hypothetical protein